jgi:hypothetical protein
VTFFIPDQAPATMAGARPSAIYFGQPVTPHPAHMHRAVAYNATLVQALRWRAPRADRTFNQVLLTGATGFPGPFLLRSLLDQLPGACLPVPVASFSSEDAVKTIGIVGGLAWPS